MSAIPSPPAVLFNTSSGQLPAQPGSLYGAFQIPENRSPFSQYPPYAPSLQNSFTQQNMYMQQPPPPHAPNAPAPDIYPSNISQYRIVSIDFIMIFVFKLLLLVLTCNLIQFLDYCSCTTVWTKSAIE